MPQQVITDYFTSQSVYPSNTQIWTIARDSAGDFDPVLLDKLYRGNGPAPKGHFILPAFDQDRETASGLSGINDSAQLGKRRPSSVCAFAGRIWYAGPTGGGGTEIYVSQIVEGLANAARCYQTNDPTAEDFNQLLATDGLVIRIPEMGEVRKLIPFNQGVAALADNGIWYIRGGDQGFKPSDFIRTKITDLGVISKTSIMEVEGSIFYVRSNGIHVLSPTEFSGQVTNLTDQKIQTLIANLNRTTLLYMQGKYNKTEKKILWFYNDSDGYDGVTRRFSYNRVLVFDIRLQSFVTYTIYPLNEQNYPAVVGAVETPDFVFSTFNEPLTLNDGTTEITLNDGTTLVTTDVAVLGEPAANLKLVTFSRVGASFNIGVTFSEFNQTSFRDWGDEDAFAYVETGWEHLGDPTKIRTAPTVSAHFNRTETAQVDDGSGGITIVNPSSCLLQAYWDFSEAASNKNNRQQQIYRPRNKIFVVGNDTDDQEVISSKTMVRGSGKAVKFRFECEPDKDCQLLSYSVTYSVKTEV